jgi:HAD superfamily hydrolase (TIGR01509 family)
MKEASMARQTRPGVLVDLDGTLVDTNYLHTLAWARALADVGEWAPMNAIHRLIGMGSDQLVQELLGHSNDAAADARARRYGELIGEAKAFPFARDVLADWHRSGLTVVIASSSPRDELDVMLGLLDADAFIDAVTTADDVDRSKPQPDVFAAALEAGSIDPARAVVIGDSIWDVHAASRAGLLTIAVETGGTSAAELEAAGAAEVHADVSELKGALSPESIERLHADHPVAPHATGQRQAAINRELDPPA